MYNYVYLDNNVVGLADLYLFICLGRVQDVLDLVSRLRRNLVGTTKLSYSFVCILFLLFL